MESTLKPEQRETAGLRGAARVFLRGRAGSGKTTTGVARLYALLESGTPGDQILVLTPQRTLAQPYFDAAAQASLPAGGPVTIQTLGGLAQRMLDLFWPLVARDAGFAHPEQPPVFLTLETSQYFMARVVQPMLGEGAFDAVKIDRNRLYSQILDNLNKSASVGFALESMAERLRTASLAEPAQLRAYDDAQEAALRFRRYCFENNLLDFSLQMELFRTALWPAFLCRNYLQQRYRHLIYDNVEEDVPVAHDVLAQWLPQFESAMLIYDDDGGYRVFLGADAASGEQLSMLCDEQVVMDANLVSSPAVEALGIAMTQSLNGQAVEVVPELHSVMSFSTQRFMPGMTDWAVEQALRLVKEEHIPAQEIVILSPFMTDALRFSLLRRMEEVGLAGKSHRPSRSLREEPATLSLLTLARLAHPDWGLNLNRHDLRMTLMQVLSDCDLVRADLLAQILYQPAHPEKGLGKFDQIRPDMQDRITYALGDSFETLRAWLDEYRQGEKVELDVFLSSLFGEVLSQPGFRLHEDFDAVAVVARLIESIQKFRRVVGNTLQREGKDTGKEYLQMVEDGILAAQYLGSWQMEEENAVLLAPAYSFLMMNRPVQVQIWLDAGSPGWWERLLQPLTHPYVLSRHWPMGKVWSAEEETRYNQANLARLVRGLLHRCRSKVYLCATSTSEQGREERGPLLRACQALLRKLAQQEAGHV